MLLSRHAVTRRVTCYPVLHGYDGAPRDARAAVLIRIAAVIYVEWELPDECRGKEGHDRQERKSLIDDGGRRFRWGQPR